MESGGAISENDEAEVSSAKSFVSETSCEGVCSDSPQLLHLSVARKLYKRTKSASDAAKVSSEKGSPVIPVQMLFDHDPSRQAQDRDQHYNVNPPAVHEKGVESFTHSDFEPGEASQSLFNSATSTADDDDDTTKDVSDCDNPSKDMFQLSTSATQNHTATQSLPNTVTSTGDADDDTTTDNNGVDPAKDTFELSIGATQNYISTQSLFNRVTSTGDDDDDTTADNNGVNPAEDTFEPCSSATQNRMSTQSLVKTVTSTADDDGDSDTTKDDNDCNNPAKVISKPSTIATQNHTLKQSLFNTVTSKADDDGDTNKDNNDDTSKDDSDKDSPTKGKDVFELGTSATQIPMTPQSEQAGQTSIHDDGDTNTDNNDDTSKDDSDKDSPAKGKDVFDLGTSATQIPMTPESEQAGQTSIHDDGDTNTDNNGDTSKDDSDKDSPAKGKDVFELGTSATQIPMTPQSQQAGQTSIQLSQRGPGSILYEESSDEGDEVSNTISALCDRLAIPDLEINSKQPNVFHPLEIEKNNRQPNFVLNQLHINRNANSKQPNSVLNQLHVDMDKNSKKPNSVWTQLHLDMDKNSKQHTSIFSPQHVEIDTSVCFTQKLLPSNVVDQRLHEREHDQKDKDSDDDSANHDTSDVNGYSIGQDIDRRSNPENGDVTLSFSRPSSETSKRDINNRQNDPTQPTTELSNINNDIAQPTAELSNRTNEETQPTTKLTNRENDEAQPTTKLSHIPQHPKASTRKFKVPYNKPLDVGSTGSVTFSGERKPNASPREQSLARRDSERTENTTGTDHLMKRKAEVGCDNLPEIIDVGVKCDDAVSQKKTKEEEAYAVKEYLIPVISSDTMDKSYRFTNNYKCVREKTGSLDTPTVLTQGQINKSTDKDHTKNNEHEAAKNGDGSLGNTRVQRTNRGESKSSQQEYKTGHNGPVSNSSLSKKIDKAITTGTSRNSDTESSSSASTEYDMEVTTSKSKNNDVEVPTSASMKNGSKVITASSKKNDLEFLTSASKKNDLEVITSTSKKNDMEDNTDMEIVEDSSSDVTMPPQSNKMEQKSWSALQRQGPGRPSPSPPSPSSPPSPPSSPSSPSPGIVNTVQDISRAVSGHRSGEGNETTILEQICAVYQRIALSVPSEADKVDILTSLEKSLRLLNKHQQQEKVALAGKIRRGKMSTSEKSQTKRKLQNLSERCGTLQSLFKKHQHLKRDETTPVIQRQNLQRTKVLPFGCVNRPGTLLDLHNQPSAIDSGKKHLPDCLSANDFPLKSKGAHCFSRQKGTEKAGAASSGSKTVHTASNANAAAGSEEKEGLVPKDNDSSISQSILTPNGRCTERKNRMDHSPPKKMIYTSQTARTESETDAQKLSSQTPLGVKDPAEKQGAPRLFESAGIPAKTPAEYLGLSQLQTTRAGIPAKTPAEYFNSSQLQTTQAGTDISSSLFTQPHKPSAESRDRNGNRPLPVDESETSSMSHDSDEVVSQNSEPMFQDSSQRSQSQSSLKSYTKPSSAKLTNEHGNRKKCQDALSVSGDAASSDLIKQKYNGVRKRSVPRTEALNTLAVKGHISNTTSGTHMNPSRTKTSSFNHKRPTSSSKSSTEGKSKDSVTSAPMKNTLKGIPGKRHVAKKPNATSGTNKISARTTTPPSKRKRSTTSSSSSSTTQGQCNDSVVLAPSGEVLNGLPGKGHVAQKPNTTRGTHNNLPRTKTPSSNRKRSTTSSSASTTPGECSVSVASAVVDQRPKPKLQRVNSLSKKNQRSPSSSSSLSTWPDDDMTQRITDAEDETTQRNNDDGGKDEMTQRINEDEDEITQRSELHGGAETMEVDEELPPASRIPKCNAPLRDAVGVTAQSQTSESSYRPKISDANLTCVGKTLVLCATSGELITTDSHNVSHMSSASTSLLRTTETTQKNIVNFSQMSSASTSLLRIREPTQKKKSSDPASSATTQYPNLVHTQSSVPEPERKQNSQFSRNLPQTSQTGLDANVTHKKPQSQFTTEAVPNKRQSNDMNFQTQCSRNITQNSKTGLAAHVSNDATENKRHSQFSTQAVFDKRQPNDRNLQQSAPRPLPPCSTPRRLPSPSSTATSMTDVFPVSSKEILRRLAQGAVSKPNNVCSEGPHLASQPWAVGAVSKPKNVCSEGTTLASRQHNSGERDPVVQTTISSRAADDVIVGASGVLDGRNCKPSAGRVPERMDVSSGLASVSGTGAVGKTSAPVVWRNGPKQLQPGTKVVVLKKVTEDPKTQAADSGAKVARRSLVRTYREMFDAGVLRPGRLTISLLFKGDEKRASILEDGRVQDWAGLTFTTPLSWYRAVTGTPHARRCIAYSKIAYKGRSLAEVGERSPISGQEKRTSSPLTATPPSPVKSSNLAFLTPRPPSDTLPNPSRQAANATSLSATASFPRGVTSTSQEVQGAATPTLPREATSSETQGGATHTLLREATSSASQGAATPTLPNGMTVSSAQGGATPIPLNADLVLASLRRLRLIGDDEVALHSSDHDLVRFWRADFAKISVTRHVWASVDDWN